MTLEERLNQLPQTADELAADVRADEKLYQDIRYKAAQQGTERRRVLRRGVLIPAAALALTAVLLIAVLPGLNGGSPLNIKSVTAGNPGQQPLPSTRADLPAGSITLDSGDSVPSFRNLWAGNSDSNFPMILLTGT